MKKYFSQIIVISFFIPIIAFGQTEATVSKTITSYVGVKNISDSQSIKKSSSSNSLNMLLQVGLINAGYNLGEPDGVVGAKTTQAIKNLQKDFGMVADGVFGARTASAFRVFSDIFPNQKVSEVKKILPEEFADFKNQLKSELKQATSDQNAQSGFVGVTRMKLPTNPKGVLTYVLSKNQPNRESSGSSSVVGALVAKLTQKPKTAETNTGSNTTIVSSGGVSIVGSSELNTNFNSSSATANTSYECVTTSEHTETCTTRSSSDNNSYYCRGSNCEVLGLTNRPSEPIEEYIAPTRFNRSIDVNERATWGQPVVFDKKTGEPTIYLKDYGYDPKNGKRNLSVIFVDSTGPVYNQ